MGSAWASTVALVGCLLLVAVVGLERNRLRRRLDRTESALTGLRLDLAATRDRVTELQGYLERRQNWAVGVAAPDALTDPAPHDRWTPVPLPEDTGTADAATAVRTDQPSDAAPKV